MKVRPSLAGFLLGFLLTFHISEHRHCHLSLNPIIMMWMSHNNINFQSQNLRKRLLWNHQTFSSFYHQVKYYSNALRQQIHCGLWLLLILICRNLFIFHAELRFRISSILINYEKDFSYIQGQASISIPLPLWYMAKYWVIQGIGDEYVFSYWQTYHN